MTRIIASALRPLRLNNSGRVFQAAADHAHHQAVQMPLGRRSVATSTPRSPTSSPPASKPAPQYSQSSYKRSATTTASSSSSSSSPSSSSSASKPANSSSSPSTTSPSTGARPANSAYAESQMNPVTHAPYAPPPGADRIPDLTTGGGFSVANNNGIDWSSSFHGLSTTPFSPEVAAVLMKPIPFEDVEVKPDGIIYLPEIKYRRILNQAFGPGGWGMAPRGELMVGERVVTREYALLVHGRFIAQARGECQFFGNDDGIATAGEGCKSNALMRCCKDLGVASELWDPRYIRDFKKKYAQDIWVEHVVTKKKRQITVRKGDDPMYPYKKSTF